MTYTIIIVSFPILYIILIQIYHLSCHVSTKENLEFHNFHFHIINIRYMFKKNLHLLKVNISIIINIA